MSLRYEIEEGTNAVKVFYPDSEAPSLYQPNWPNGDEWLNSEEAEGWAKLYIDSIEIESAPYAPVARGEEGHRKMTEEEIQQLREEEEAKLNQLKNSVE
jgi:hypothetical protein